MSKIILTDWPKFETIEAHYRGVETRKLLKAHSFCFHGMMCCDSEQAGGYTIVYYPDAIEKELKFRNIAIPTYSKSDGGLL